MDGRNCVRVILLLIFPVWDLRIKLFFIFFFLIVRLWSEETKLYLLFGAFSKADTMDLPDIC